jgi:hypothetical protein
MLFHGRLEQVNQNYVMLVQKRIDSHTYVVLSKNYFNIANNFEILSQSSDCFKIIKLHKITLQDGSTTTIVNTPMQEITISIDQCVNLLPNDMLRLVC